MFCHPMQDYTRDGFKFHSDFDMAWGKMSLRIMRDGNRDLCFRTPQVATLAWEDLEYGRLTNPTLLCEPDTMQHLFNSLWDCGFRPNGGARSEAIVAAKDQHIEDLRNICTKLLECP